MPFNRYRRAAWAAILLGTAVAGGALSWEWRLQRASLAEAVGDTAALRGKLNQLSRASPASRRDNFSDLRAAPHDSLFNENLAASAEANKVSVTEVTLGAPANSAGHTRRREVSLRLRGSYVQIKQTVADLLAAHGTLSLESISLRRGRPGDPVIDADVQLAFHSLVPQ